MIILFRLCLFIAVLLSVKTKSNILNPYIMLMHGMVWFLLLHNTSKFFGASLVYMKLHDIMPLLRL